MNVQEEVELLSGVDVFEGLSKEEIREILDDLLRRNAEINLQAGEVFYTPRQPDGKLFVLKQGRVRIYKMEASREFTLEMVDAGTVFGEVAFTPHALRDAYAEAMEPSIVLAMERADVERLIREKPQVGLRMISLLAERLRYYETRLGHNPKRGAGEAGEPDPLSRRERGCAGSGRDPPTNQLHPRAPWHHDRGQPRGGDQGIRAPSGRGGPADQAASHLRRGRRSPREGCGKALGGSASRSAGGRRSASRHRSRGARRGGPRGLAIPGQDRREEQVLLRESPGRRLQALE